ncbi:MAG: magnesium transporter [Pseudomonadota bacterium]|jgi:Mg2+-importing ATPase
MFQALRHRYARFLKRHGLARFFRRHTIWEPHAALPLADAVSSQLKKFAALDEAAVLAALHTQHEGLSDDEAAKRRREVGENQLAQDKPLPAWQHLFHCYGNPFNLLLTLLALVSWLTQDTRATVVILVMVVLSTLMRFIHEARSAKAADGLKTRVGNTASVLRGVTIELPIRALVPGDVVMLSAGDMVPADLRLLHAKDLFVSQSAMTGEALPVEKFPAPHAHEANPLALNNILFMGTNVVSGSGVAVVLATGSRTSFGQMAEHLAAAPREPTAFAAGVNRVSWLLIRFMLVMAPVVLVINGLSKGDWLEAMLFSLAVAVGLTPEMLPMIVTTTLAKGAVMLSAKKVVVKRLDAIQNFGAMTVLCTDKTGTLTQNRIILERHIDVTGQDSPAVLEFAYLNSHYQTGLKNLLDVAVLEHVDMKHRLDIDRSYRKVDEIPFDFSRRRMSVVVCEREHHHELICKGALDEVLDVCVQVREGDKDTPLDSAARGRISTLAASLARQGLRVVAVAVKDAPLDQTTFGVRDETGLTLIGFVAFLDPPKESTAPAIKALKAHGVEVKILTGDNEYVTEKICRDVGHTVRGIRLGPELEAMSEEALRQAVREANVFARLTPLQKERIVSLLKDEGEVVGFLGDGINDAPALRAADIGISVEGAVDIAREAADIILLEKSLMVLDEGVMEGRRTFANMGKYIKMTASSNFGNVLSVMMASAFLPFLPMLPLQLLVQNLLYDISQIAIPFDAVDEDTLQKPQHWQADDLSRFMLWFGPLSSLFDGITFAALWWIFEANSPDRAAVFQSGWFIEGLMSQALIVHLIRTRKLPFIQSRASAPLLFATAAVMLVAVWLPMGSLAGYFGMAPLPAGYFAFVGVALAGYCILAQGLKAVYARRYGWR